MVREASVLKRAFSNVGILSVPFEISTPTGLDTKEHNPLVLYTKTVKCQTNQQIIYMIV